MRIIPTILVKTKKEFIKNLELLLPITKQIQVDIMDGIFVKQKSVALWRIPSLKKYNKQFEAHLMVARPKKYIAKLKRKGFEKIIFHVESTNRPEKVIETIKKRKLTAFLAINPKTKIEQIIPHLKSVDGILLMGVHPGKSGQKLLPQTLTKIKQLRKMNKKMPIQIDGGVNDKTAKKLAKAGATILNTGSFVSGAKDPKAALAKLRKAITI